MVQNTQINVIEDQIRECYGRVVYSHKTQEKCSDILSSRLNRLKLIQIFLGAATSTGLVIALVGKTEIGTIASLISSTFLLGINLYTKEYDLGSIAQKHKDAANKLWNIRESYISLLADIRFGDKTVHEIREKREQLQQELSEIYICAPCTNSKAYEEAGKALKDCEEMTFSDNEIDKFLPKKLRNTERENVISGKLPDIE